MKRDALALLLIVLATIVLTVACLTAVSFFQPRKTSATNACMNNLRQLDGAKQQWALGYGKDSNSVPSWEDIRPYIGHGTEADIRNLRCQEGGTYTLGRAADPPKCSVGGPSHTLN